MVMSPLLRPLGRMPPSSSSSSPPLQQLLHLPRLLSSSSVSNPLLGVSVPTTPKEVVGASGPLAKRAAAAEEEELRCSWNEKRLPVSPKKLRVVANMAIGLYWREAMLQLEFCRKNIAVHVKNTIAKAVRSAEQDHGLDATRLVVDQLAVGKGSYLKELDYKAKGRAGIMKRKESHLYCVLKQVSPAKVAQTRFFGRWRQAARLREIPWEERVASLPRYTPIPGYEPGSYRVRDPLVGEGMLRKPHSVRRRRQQRNNNGGAAAAAGRGGAGGADTQPPAAE